MRIGERILMVIKKRGGFVKKVVGCRVLWFLFINCITYGKSGQKYVYCVSRSFKKRENIISIKKLCKLSI